MHGLQTGRLRRSEKPGHVCGELLELCARIHLVDGQCNELQPLRGGLVRHQHHGVRKLPQRHLLCCGRCRLHGVRSWYLRSGRGLLWLCYVLRWLHLTKRRLDLQHVRPGHGLGQQCWPMHFVPRWHLCQRRHHELHALRAWQLLLFNRRRRLQPLRGRLVCCEPRR